MIWPGLVALVLGVLNALFSIWRWRADRTYVAWSFAARRALAVDMSPKPMATVTNSGTATAYDVRVTVSEDRRHEFDQGGWMLGTMTHIAPGESEQFKLQDDNVAQWRVSWRDRPGGRVRRGQYDEAGNSVRPRRRELLGAKIAGRPLAR